MKDVLRLALRYLAFHKGRTAILIACITLTFLFPLAVHWLLASYQTAIGARARATPLVLGAKGSRYDLVLNTLYYRGKVPAPILIGEAERVSESGLALPIPILARHAAGGMPLVGTSPDYYRFRGLGVARGSLPLVLGECTLGAQAARASGLGPGDHLLTDTETVYDISKGYPLRMRVAGVLAETGTPDDRAVFASVETAWIVEGIGHGHGAAADQRPAQVLQKDGDRVVLNASVREWEEVTPANMDSWHFHLPRAERPLTGILVVPRSDKAATLLKGRYRLSKTAQLLEPAEVVEEIFGFVFEIKAFFDAHVVLVTGATTLFLLLVVLLSVRVRRREIETLHRIGCARSMVARIFGTELAITVLAGLLIAAVLAGIFVHVMQRTHGMV